MSAPLGEVFWTGRFDYQPPWKRECHTHGFFQLICFRSGEGRFYLEGKNLAICPGRAVMIKPGQIHGMSASSRIKTLDIKFNVNDGDLRDRLFRSGSVFADKEGRISALLEHIRWEGEHRALLFREMCHAYLVQLLVACLRQSPEEQGNHQDAAAEEEPAVAQDDISRKVADFVKQHYPEPLSVRGIARMLGVSERDLRYRLRNSTGMSPARYLTRYRIERAKELILYSEDALKVIAATTGFKSIHHFNRVFARFAGDPPGAWRRHYREGICKDVCIDQQFSRALRETDNPARRPV